MMRNKLLNYAFPLYVALVVGFIISVPILVLDPSMQILAYIITVWGAEVGIFSTIRYTYPHLYPLRLVLIWGFCCYGVYTFWKSVVCPYLKPTIDKYEAWMNKGKTRAFAFITVSFLLLISLGGFEIGLRIAGIHHPYHSRYIVQEDGWMHTFKPNHDFEYLTSDFTQKVSANALGLTDRVWPVNKQKRLRIAAFGDSFTQGVGTVNDSCYPHVLGMMMPDAEVMNWGVGGSDPVFEYLLLKVGINYHPDIATLAINESDIDDIRTRGGFERFHNDGTVRYRKGPWWEGLYRYSCISRVYVHYFAPFYASTHERPQDVEIEKAKSQIVIRQAIDSFESVCAAHHIRCVLLFHPIVSEVRQGYMDNGPVMAYARSQHYETLDVLQAFYHSGMDSANVQDYFWMHDGHNNGRGYHLFAGILRDYFTTHPFLPDSSTDYTAARSMK